VAGWRRLPLFASRDVPKGQVRVGSEEQVSGVRGHGLGTGGWGLGKKNRFQVSAEEQVSGVREAERDSSLRSELVTFLVFWPYKGI